MAIDMYSPRSMSTSEMSNPASRSSQDTIGATRPLLDTIPQHLSSEVNGVMNGRSSSTAPVNVPSPRGNSTNNYLHTLHTHSTIAEGIVPDRMMSWGSYTSPIIGPRSYTERSGFERSFDRSPSPHGRKPLAGSMADAFAASKSTSGLIRRLSRGAHNRLRRRASTTQSMRAREQSAGPVLLRRRSDSNGTSDYGPDVSDLELDSTADDLVENTSNGNKESGLSAAFNRQVNDVPPFESGQAHADPTILLTGTYLIKCTKNHRKTIKFWIEPNSARVCWHTSNPLKSFYIDDCELRTGAESKNAREGVQVSPEEEPLLLTIVYIPMERRNMKKTMHLLMPRQSIMRAWRDCLKQVNRDRISCMNALSPMTEKSERGMLALWQRVMQAKGAKGTLDLDGARRVCRTLEINCTDDTVVAHFRKVDRTGSGLLDYAAYQDFINSFKNRRDIEHLFRNITHGTFMDMDLEDFFRFLREDQGVQVDKEKEQWKAVFDRFAVSVANRAALPDAEPSIGQKYMTLQGFQNFLTSVYNDPLTSGKTAVSLDRPLNEYFISSSHNTYLLGRQLAGLSSVEGYISSLIKGCRCVEIDCWDGENGQPVVTHGRTMTTKISFEDCISTVAKYAFHSSPYPLIVSLEVHCCAEQQATMVDIMTKYWGDMLVTEPITNNTLSLPSPEELRHRILVKVKSAESVEANQVMTEMTSGRSRARSLGSTVTRSSSFEAQGYSSPALMSSTSTAATTPSEALPASAFYSPTTPTGIAPPTSSTDDSDALVPLPDITGKRKTSKIIPKLGKLGVYAQGIKYSGFTDAQAKTYNHIHSFSENTFDKLCRKNVESKEQLVKHNMHHLMRVYPAARRLDSSNFNPLQAWRRGVQMAALNWQTFDVHQQVNEAMFAAGADHLGYVLKPEELRHAKHLPIADTIGDTAERRANKGKKLVRFTVDVISAQRLPRPWNQPIEAGMNPFIEFEMYSAEDKGQGIATSEGGTDVSARDGSSGIGDPLRKRTKCVAGNGFDPSFNDSITMTVQTKYPSLIFVRWTVWNRPDTRKQQKNVLLATFTAKLSSLQQGYRQLPLFNSHGEQYQDAKLFVKIRKEAPVPLEITDNTYGAVDTAPLPQRTDSTRSDRGWSRRIFSRNPSERRRTDHYSPSDQNSQLSRASSMDRDSNI